MSTLATAVLSFSKVLLPVAFVLLAVAFAWLLFWKFILEPNPLIRDFFDLEKTKNKPTDSHNGQRISLAGGSDKKQTKKL
jgi:hypothetical protein